MSFIPAQLIQKKRDGETHSSAEIQYLVDNYTSGEIPDYQMAAWLMAVFFRGLSDKETATFTGAMKNSGRVFELDFLAGPRVDKHSTGGVGDKTSLILGPIAAAGGVNIPMIAGRSLGHTGGTLDKLMSIPGFRLDLSYEEFTENLKKHRFSLMSQTEDICPADRKLYALRDVTATVASLPLICGSIMSKKLAEDLNGLVLDVKYGTGAFMKSMDEAEKLANLLMRTGEHNGVKVTALLSDMNQPLGRFVGNALEVRESIEILQGKSFTVEGRDHYARTRELSLQLAAQMFLLAEIQPNLNKALDFAQEILNSGKAWEAFSQLCEYQGPADWENLPIAKNQVEVLSTQTGWIQSFDTEKIGMASLELGAGRKKSTDSVLPAVGIECHAHIGKNIQNKEVLFTLHCDDKEAVDEVKNLLLDATKVSAEKTLEPSLIGKVLGKS